MAASINPPNYDYDPESESAQDLTGRQDDVVIAWAFHLLHLRQRYSTIYRLNSVMGVTGTGKSSVGPTFRKPCWDSLRRIPFFQFIKLLTGDTTVGVGHDLESETSDVQVLHFHDRDSGRKVTIVDTPGFDDSRADFSDTKILKTIADFLLKECVYLSDFNPLLLVY